MLYPEYRTWRKEGIREEDGVLVASDIGREWFLPWWWDHYSKHNSHPVAFVDFGMSEEMKDWCRKRGEFIRLQVADVFVAKQEEVDPALAFHWIMTSERNFWLSRNAWFKKPLACLQSPFRRTIWIDLDCEIRGSIAPLFSFTDSTAGFSMRREETLQRGIPIYNSGVLSFKYGLPLFETWANECMEKSDLFRGDQEVLSHLIAQEKWEIKKLPFEMNWFYDCGENPNALIVHWYGTGHLQIRHQIGANNPLLIPLDSYYYPDILKEK